MSELAIKQAAPDFLTSGLEKLKGEKPVSAKAEKARLKKATKEFEAFFMYQMMKTMRETVPENPLVKDSPFSQGSGKETFTQMFDMEIARKISGGRESSIADILYNSLEKLVDIEFQEKPEGKLHLNPLPAGKPEFQQLEKEPQPIKRSKTLIKIDKSAPDFIKSVGSLNTRSAQNVSKNPKAP